MMVHKDALIILLNRFNQKIITGIAHNVEGWQEIYLQMYTMTV